MSYGVYPYGSASYGGAPAAGDTKVVIAVQAITLTHHIPVWVVKHSNPATFAISMSLHAPVLKSSTQASTQALSLTQQAPVGHISVFPTTLTLALTLQAPTPNPRHIHPAEFDLTLSFGGPVTPDIEYGPATFPMTLTIHAPAPSVVTPVVGTAAPFLLGLVTPSARTNNPRIVRYIKDPIVTGGCPQCGTFLYEKNSMPVESEAVYMGRNPDRGVFDDRKQVKCGRCGFTCFMQRDVALPEGSKAGWGMKYTEIEAGS